MGSILQLVTGLAVLTAGAEVLVRYAVKLSLAARVSPLVVGLTVVAFGTSMPELVVSGQSAWRGQTDIAVGNVVGSNIFNVLFILGASALITPLVVDHKLIRFDVPLMIALSALLWLLAHDGTIGRVEGALFVAGLAAFTGWSIVSGRREETTPRDDEFTRAHLQDMPLSAGRLLRWVAGIVIALVLLFIGSRVFVAGAVDIARRLGVSELVIGLTLVSVGTSLPEVATSVIAAWKGQRDIAVGNVVGSNIFNILGVLGVSAVIAPAGIAVAPVALKLDLPVMTAAALACLPIFFTGHRIDRWEGGLFLAYYGAYTAALVLMALESATLDSFRLAMLGFVLPLTAVTLLVTVVRAMRNSRRSSS